MKRVIVLATLLTVGALSLVVAASQQPAAGAAAQAAPKVVEVESVAAVKSAGACARLAS